jgi:hypothetical protein
VPVEVEILEILVLALVAGEFGEEELLAHGRLALMPMVGGIDRIVKLRCPADSG